MPVVHHLGLRVNVDVPDAHVEILAESGWLLGPHPDTDPDYPLRVLPVVEPVPVKSPKPPKE